MQTSRRYSHRWALGPALPYSGKRILPVRAARALWARSRRRLEVNFPSAASHFYRGLASSVVDSLRTIILERQIEWSNLERLFIHVPKCGGTSVNEVLRAERFEIIMSLPQLERLVVEGDRRGPRLLSLDHLSTDILVSLGLLTKSQIERVEAFSIIRNPYSRLLSSYDFHRRYGFVTEKTTFMKYLEKIEAGDWDTESKNVFGLSHALPTSYFLKPKLWEGPKTILRLEDPSSVKDYLEKTAGEKVSLNRRNQGRSESRRTPHPWEVEVINRVYHDDFALGDYPKETH